MRKKDRNQDDRDRWIRRKEKETKRRKEKCKCDNCGNIICKGDIARHKKSKKCKNHTL